MASSSQQSESNNTTQNANGTTGHNSNDTADNNDSSDNNNNISKNSKNDARNEHAPVAINLRSTATTPNPVQHLHYESLPALNLNHPPFYGTYRDSTDGVPQYHPFSDDDGDDDDDGQELEEENREESENQFSRIHRVDHAYSDRSGRQRQQRDEEESDSGGGRRRSRWERRRGVVMKMRKAMIWIVVLPLLLGALWVCINLFRKDETL
ncbi:hypothetical protein B0T13DRAFT_288179 [Neurospora crassa]|nr:hypothetical protein B0T13DRAFT_288179 [Neurospora crassa]